MRMRRLEEPLPPDPMLFAALPPREEPRALTAHYASSLAGCLRRDFYRWTQAPITNPANLTQRQKMRAGEIAQTYLVAGLREFAEAHGAQILSLQEEVPFTLTYPQLEHPIRGRADLIITLDFGDGPRTFLVECKSTAQFGTRELIGHYNRRGEWVEGTPLGHPAYIAQLMAYTQAFGDQVDHAVLLVMDRNTTVNASYEIRYHPNGRAFYALLPKFRPEDGPVYPTWHPIPFTWEDVLRRLELVEFHVREGVLPERYDPLTGEVFRAAFNGKGQRIHQRDVEGKREGENWWMCGVCPYLDHCWLGATEPREAG